MWKCMCGPVVEVAVFSGGKKEKQDEPVCENLLIAVRAKQRGVKNY